MSDTQPHGETATPMPHHTAGAAALRAQAHPLAEPSVSVAAIYGLVGAVEHAGVPRERFLRAAGLDAAQLAKPDARIPRTRIYQLCDLALELTGDPALGLHWSERVNEGSFSPLSHLMANAATLRQAFEAADKFHRLLTDQSRFELIERHDQATVRVFLSGDSPDARRFLAEMAVAGVFHLLRHVSTRPLAELVGFEYAAPAYTAEYMRVFHGRVHFDQPFTGVVFERAMLDWPALRRDDDVHEAIEAVARRRLDRMTRSTPYAVRVREFLIRERKGLRTDMSVVARALHISVRSLRRRLADEGTPYGDIANEALADVAKHLLRDKQRSIQETAYELGFASFSAFHRAFRRSTGTTPNAFRDSVLSLGSP